MTDREEVRQALREVLLAIGGFEVRVGLCTELPEDEKRQVREARSRLSAVAGDGSLLLRQLGKDAGCDKAESRDLGGGVLWLSSCSLPFGHSGPHRGVGEPSPEAIAEAEAFRKHADVKP